MANANTELLKWINECLARGLAPDALKDTAVQAGWHPGIVDEAMDEALGGNDAPAAATIPKAPDAPVTGIPGPDLGQSENWVDVDGRRIYISAVVKLPRIVVFQNFLEPYECDELIELAKPRLQRSLTIDNATGGEQLHKARTSDGMFFRRGEFPLCERIERRIAAAVRWPVENGEGIQVLHYHHGAQYEPHYDYFDPAQPGTAKIIQRGGQRVGTVVMYLATPARGGGTSFPDIGLEVAPMKGSAVFFAYDKPHPDTKTLHGGSPVTQGEKYVATKWMREREFA